MALQEEFEQQGNFLFKYRGSLPIFILILGFAVYAFLRMETPTLFTAGFYNQPFEFIALGVSFFGLAIRIFTVGHTPKNTSGRNTKAQVAETVNTSGIYSCVRHPLYLGNFFMWLGIGMLTRSVWFNVSFILFYWIYYERIMFAEEQFLRKKFGEAYTNWAAKTPAFIPSFKNWKAPIEKFSFKKVIKKEKNGLLAIFLVFYLFELIGQYIDNKTFWINETYWLYSLIVMAVLYLILKILKHSTKVFEEEGR